MTILLESNNKYITTFARFTHLQLVFYSFSLYKQQKKKYLINWKLEPLLEV